MLLRQGIFWLQLGSGVLKSTVRYECKVDGRFLSRADGRFLSRADGWFLSRADGWLFWERIKSPLIARPN